jgi:hypothetical protein
MTDTAARADVLRDAMLAAVTADAALVERAYTEDVTGWSPVMEVTSRDDLAADLAGRAAAFSEDEELALEPTGRRLELRGVVIAEFEGDRIRQFRQYWNEVELLDGLGLLPD